VKNKTVMIKILAVLGTATVLAPFVFMIITSIIGSLSIGVFRMDYLIPAELAPLVLLGALMIFWAALLSSYRIKLIISTMVAAMVFLALSMIIAAMSGLASGAMQPKGTVWAIVILTLILYGITTAGIGVEGIMLIKKLFKNKK